MLASIRARRVRWLSAATGLLIVSWVAAGVAQEVPPGFGRERDARGRAEEEAVRRRFEELRRRQLGATAEDTPDFGRVPTLQTPNSSRFGGARQRSATADVAEPTAVSQAETAEVAASAASIDLDVAILQLSTRVPKLDAVDRAATDKALAQLKDWEATGKIAARESMRLSTVDRQPATVQHGEQASIVTSQMSAAGGRGASRVAYSRQSLGTLITATPRIDGGDVVVELQVERSSLEPAATGEEPPGEAELAVPPSIVTLTTKSTLRVASGQCVVAYCKESSVATDQAQTQLILLSAHVTPATAAGTQTGAAESEKSEMKVFSLRFLQAASAQRMIETLMQAPGLRVAADERANTLIAMGSPERLAQIEALLVRLDQLGANPSLRRQARESAPEESPVQPSPAPNPPPTSAPEDRDEPVPSQSARPAAAKPAATTKSAADVPEQTTIYYLRNTDAASMIRAIQAVLPEGAVQVAADPRLNAVIARGSKGRIEELEKLLGEYNETHRRVVLPAKK